VGEGGKKEIEEGVLLGRREYIPTTVRVLHFLLNLKWVIYFQCRNSIRGSFIKIRFVCECGHIRFIIASYYRYITYRYVQSSPYLVISNVSHQFITSFNTDLINEMFHSSVNYSSVTVLKLCLNIDKTTICFSPCDKEVITVDVS
jgi:hypothetical protein